MSNKKQSSIEYLGYELNTKLFYNISPELWDEVNKIFEQAKAMHKKEIEDTFECGYSSGYRDNGKDGKQYYNETFEQ